MDTSAPAIAAEPAGRPSETPVARLAQARLAYPGPGGEVVVLDGIDLVVAAGEIVGITGTSGSGKSSLIALVGGLERPSGGAVEVMGLDMAGASERRRTRLRRDAMGVVFQAYHLVPAMTALENVALPLVLAGIDDPQGRAADLLDAVGLGHRMDHRPAALSGGEQQRVAIARAFVARPQLILADEPTGNLDQRTGAAVADTMFDLTREAGAAMVLVTHDPALAARCDRQVALDAGRVAGADGMVEEGGHARPGLAARAG
ncbi:MAG: ATP-binding cassette domain-containing protein [Alphaproteobacteria bacterium]|jgi:putative ABC transport system ATP-binding protein|nr:ATP-binding cassette domain-containing protein [Alphaproteobacteria bacterium]